MYVGAAAASRWHLPNLPPGAEVWVKRDDLSGMQLSGNKAGGVMTCYQRAALLLRRVRCFDS
jgi:hypothetical protein